MLENKKKTVFSKSIAVNERSAGFLSGVAVLSLSTVIVKLIGLACKIPMLAILGADGMGYFNSAYTVYTFFYIIGSAGIPKAISILCAKSSAGEAKSIFSSIFKILAVPSDMWDFGFLTRNQTCPP